MKRTVFFALLLACDAAAARDVGQILSRSDPRISTWFRTAQSPTGTSCCDEADGCGERLTVKIAHGEPTVIFPSWWAASDGYHLSLVDSTDLRSIHLIWDGAVVRDNPTGGAVVWLSRENGIVLVHCFSPGPQRSVRDADEGEHFASENRLFSSNRNGERSVATHPSANQKEN